MAQLADALLHVNLREIEQKESALAAAHAADFSQYYSQPELDERTQKIFLDFAGYCQHYGVRACPAKPASVAAFLLDIPAPAEVWANILPAIEAVHNHFGQANPCASDLVRAIVDKDLDPIEPPRSWNKEEKEEFKTFPRQAQFAIARREKDREAHLRRRQNELAEAIKEAKRQSDTAAEPTSVTQKEVFTNGKEA